MKLYRAWINQPSTLQPLHALHGTYCIACDRDGANVHLYFTEGDVHSMVAPRTCIARVYLSDAETKVHHG